MRWPILLIPSLAWGACTASLTPRAGYAEVRTVCVDHTKVGTVSNTDQASFAFPIVYTEADWATTGNGGKVQHTVTQSGGAGITIPADWVVTSDSLGTTLCTGWEFGSYNVATGAAVVYVNCGTLSHTTDTAFYISAGNALVSTQQMTVSATWAGYVGVWHLDFLAGAGPFTYADSSSNGGTATDAANATVAGPIGLAVDDTSGSVANTPVYTGGAGLPTGSSSRTMEAWYNTQGIGCSNTSGQYGILGYGGSGNNQEMVLACFGLSNHSFGVDYQNANCAPPHTDTDSLWHQVVGVVTATTVDPTKVYFDGTVAYDGVGGCFNGGNTIATTAATLTIATYATFNLRFKGFVDEARISSSVRSADWIRTEYNSINSPGTFTSISSAVLGGAPPPFGIINQ